MKISYDSIHYITVAIERIQRWQKRWSKLDEANLAGTASRSLEKLQQQLITKKLESEEAKK